MSPIWVKKSLAIGRRDTGDGGGRSSEREKGRCGFEIQALPTMTIG